MAGTALEKYSDDQGSTGHSSSHGSSHGAVEQHRSGGELVRYNPDAPSEEWGWHGEWRLFAAKGSKTLLVIFTLTMFAMLFGNHVSRVEDVYLVLIGLGMVVWLAWREAAARRRRRTRP